MSMRSIFFFVVVWNESYFYVCLANSSFCYDFLGKGRLMIIFGGRQIWLKFIS